MFLMDAHFTLRCWFNQIQRKAAAKIGVDLVLPRHSFCKTVLFFCRLVNLAL